MIIVIINYIINYITIIFIIKQSNDFRMIIMITNILCIITIIIIMIVINPTICI